MKKRLLLLGLSFYTSVSIANADGPDFFRVSSENSIQMFEKMQANSKLVLLVPPDTNGIKNLGCTGGTSLQAWQKMTEQQRETSKNNAWCNVGVQGKTGWVLSKYLSEGNRIEETPSFNCNAAHPHEIEILICGNTELILLDNELASVYQNAISKAKAMTKGSENVLSDLKQKQIGWIKERNECWKEIGAKLTCSISKYKERIEALQNYKNKY
ncbi:MULTISPECIES: lysozyme inhibitor LprI family protein [Pseudoalteromonas]|uniref:lysozyme inhibitor LprI family protein n=1 Tax=Pseudoalteromonas TaxID=53246 RepID=UPI0007857E5C|nr:lysozyme inhibitor LprI family protein [Pseudoalteromonas arabiensis]